MQEYRDFEDEQEEQEEETADQPIHFFCKLTFGQFFTLMVLEIITLCFVFYLGARYGNEYLKLDVISETKKEPVQIVTERVEKEKVSEMDELQQMARDALQGEKKDLKERVKEILERQKGPTTPPLGEPVDESNVANQDYNSSEPTGPITEAEMLQKIEEVRREMMKNSGIPQQGSAASQAAQNGQAISGELNENGGRTFIPPSKPENPSTEQIVKVKSTDDAKFSVQVGSYPDVKEASYRVEEWKAKGYPAYMMIANLGDKGQWYRVRIGAFASKDDAGKYLNNMQNKEGIGDAYVVKNEQ